MNDVFVQSSLSRILRTVFYFGVGQLRPSASTGNYRDRGVPDGPRDDSRHSDVPHLPVHGPQRSRARRTAHPPADDSVSHILDSIDRLRLGVGVGRLELRSSRCDGPRSASRQSCGCGVGEAGRAGRVSTRRLGTPQPAVGRAVFVGRFGPQRAVGRDPSLHRPHGDHDLCGVVRVRRDRDLSRTPGHDDARPLCLGAWIVVAVCI